MEQYINKIINADCLDILKQLPDNCVDLVLTDPPYGTTACKWDLVVPFDLLWAQLNRIIKDNGAIVMCGQEPFSTHLRMSNINDWRYDYVWVKQKGTDFVNANKKPMKYHELIHVFYKRQPTFNIQWMERKSDRIKQAQKNNYKGFRVYSESMPCNSAETSIDFNKYDPHKKRQGSVIYCSSVVSNSKEKQPHPTQKPVFLMELMIKTYSNENDLVLDCFSGSGTTAVACHNLKRRFICIEKDPEYWRLSCERLEQAQRQQMLF